MILRATALATALALVSALPATAQDAHVWTVTESFDDVTFAIESAIIGEGLVIDHVSHVGDMLERTRADVGSDVVLFDQADVFTFCSSTVSRAVMEADPMNIVHCPYGIFVAARADRPGEVTVGFRDYPEGPMDTVEDLLDRIIRAAIAPD
jgi:hypothetical protein